MPGQEIKQLVIWVHPFHTAGNWNMMRSPALTAEEFRAGMNVVLNEMNRAVAAMAKKPGTALALVEPGFFTGENARFNPLTKEIQDKFVGQCRESFGSRFVVMPPDIGNAYGSRDAASINIEEEITAKLKKLVAQKPFSNQLTVFRLGEYTSDQIEFCVTRANKRIVQVLKDKFGVIVPKEKQLLMRKFSFGTSQPQQLLWHAAKKRRFLPVGERAVFWEPPASKKGGCPRRPRTKP
jgi:hypothetical protein